MTRVLLSLFIIASYATGLHGQLVFTSGTNTNQALFERIDGNSVPINTGLGTHNLPGLSRDGRFITFGTPEAPQGNGINPSSDLFVYDRATQLTRRVVDNFSTFDGGFQIWNDVLSSQMSPNGQFIAYGVAIFRALGGTGGQATNELNIIDSNTGLLISNPTGARGPSSDAFAAEFRGISFSPDGQSFVTPLYRFIGISDPLPIELPTIVRFDRDPNSGQWILGPTLSVPQWSRNQQTLLAAASIHTYPALSPSGQGLAYFSVLVPDANTGTQPYTSRVAIANADGTGTQLLTTFSPGFVPTGLTWTQDGTAIIVSISQQTNFGTNFIPAPLRSNSAVYSVSTADGTTTQISEIGNGVAPMLPLIAAPIPLDTRISLNTSVDSQGNLVVQSNAVPVGRTLSLESSENGLNNFQAMQNVTGAQLGQGITLPLGAGSLFFRLVE